MTLHASDEKAIDTIDAAFFSGDTFEKKENLERIEYFLARWLRKTNEIRANLKQEPLIMKSRHGTHTPGPWEIISDGWIIGSNSEKVTDYMGCGTHEAYIENPYDEALILAAPELLATLKLIATERLVSKDGEFGKVVFAAIEKATTPIRKEA